MLADLGVSTLPIPEHMRMQLVEVLNNNFDKFAASLTDFKNSLVAVHTIKTGVAKPFRHKLRTIFIARRHAFEQEVENPLAIGSILKANSCACPYVSEFVTTPNKDNSLQMCVGYRNINAQTEKDAYHLSRSDQV